MRAALLLAAGLALAAAAPAPADHAAERAAVAAAMARHDPAAAVAAVRSWAAAHPDDLDGQRDLPLLLRLQGDAAGWDAARDGLVASWARLKAHGAPPPSDPSFLVDLFRVGRDTVLATQCYEPAGRWNVRYKIAVLDADRRLSSFFTLESAETDNQVARELGGDPAQRVASLDHFRPGVHETVTMLRGIPLYDDIRRMVVEYLQRPNPAAASSTSGPGLSDEGCETVR